MSLTLFKLSAARQIEQSIQAQVQNVLAQNPGNAQQIETIRQQAMEQLNGLNLQSNSTTTPDYNRVFNTINSTIEEAIVGIRLPIEIRAKEDALRNIEQLKLRKLQLDNSLIQARAEANLLNNQLQTNVAEKNQQLQQKEVLINELTSEKVDLIAQTNLINREKESLQHTKDNLEIEKQNLSQELSIKSRSVVQLQQQSNQASILRQQNEVLKNRLEELRTKSTQISQKANKKLIKLLRENARLQLQKSQTNQILTGLRNLQEGSQAPISSISFGSDEDLGHQDLDDSDNDSTITEITIASTSTEDPINL